MGKSKLKKQLAAEERARQEKRQAELVKKSEPPLVEPPPIQPPSASTDPRLRKNCPPLAPPSGSTSHPVAGLNLHPSGGGPNLLPPGAGPNLHPPPKGPPFYPPTGSFSFSSRPFSGVPNQLPPFMPPHFQPPYTGPQLLPLPNFAPPSAAAPSYPYGDPANQQVPSGYNQQGHYNQLLQSVPQRLASIRVDPPPTNSSNYQPHYDRKNDRRSNRDSYDQRRGGPSRRDNHPKDRDNQQRDYDNKNHRHQNRQNHEPYERRRRPSAQESKPRHEKRVRTERTFEERVKEERQKKEYEAAEKKKKDAEYQKLLEYNKSDASNLILGNEDIYQDDSSEDEMKIIEPVPSNKRTNEKNGESTVQKKSKPASVSPSSSSESGISESDESDSSNDSDASSSSSAKMEELESEMYSCVIAQKPKHHFSGKDFIIDKNPTPITESSFIDGSHLNRRKKPQRSLLTSTNWDHYMKVNPPRINLSAREDKNGLIHLTPAEVIQNLNIQMVDVNKKLNKSRKDTAAWVDKIRLMRSIHHYQNLLRHPRADAEQKAFQYEVINLLEEAIEECSIKDLEGLLVCYFNYLIETKCEGFEAKFLRLHDGYIKNNYFIGSAQIWECYFKFVLHTKGDMKSELDLALGKVSETRNASYRKEAVDLDKLDLFLLDLVVNKCRLDIEQGRPHMVIAIIQTITDFYYFRPKDLERKAFDWKFGQFRKYWNLKYNRIGEKNAKVWDSITHKTELTKVEHREQSRLEAAWVKQQLLKAREAEDDLDIPDEVGHPDINAFISMENLRQSFYWHPLKYEHSHEDVITSKKTTENGFYITDSLDEEAGNIDYIDEQTEDKANTSYLDRVVTFEMVEPFINIFREPIEALSGSSFEEDMKKFKLSCKKMILRLLQLMGVSVDSAFFYSSEQLLLQLWPAPQVQDLASNYNGLLPFLILFSSQMMSSDLCDFKEELIAMVVDTFAAFLRKIDLEDEEGRRAFDDFKTWIMAIFEQKLNAPKDRYLFFFLKAKMFELDLFVRKFVRGSHFIDENERCLTEDQEMFDEIAAFISEIGEGPQLEIGTRKPVLLWTVIMLAEHLPSQRTITGKEDKNVTLTRGRLLYLFGDEGHFITSFFKIGDDDEDQVKVYSFDLATSEDLYKSLYEECVPDGETSLSCVVGTVKDLTLRLYDMATWESTGTPRYSDLSKEHWQLCRHKKEKKDETNKDNQKDATEKKNKIDFNTPVSFPETSVETLITRIELGEDLLDAGVITHNTYFLWVAYYFVVYPFDPRIWRHALKLSAVTPKLQKLFPVKGKNQKSHFMRLLHEIITCIQAWNDAEDFEWRQGNDEKRRHGSVSGHLKRLLSLVREQPFPDTFPLRACLAYESSFQNESKATAVCAEYLPYFNYSKLLKMYSFKFADYNKLNLSQGMGDSYLWFTKIDEVAGNRKEIS